MKKSATGEVQLPATPNYMKPTASFEARKAANRAMELEERKRAVTKNPSFKSAIAVDFERPTCSSVLKDRKFPAYLALNPGGTECDGVSAVKVCPYAYCSLNGGRHARSASSILSARRPAIKGIIRQNLLKRNGEEEAAVEIELSIVDSDFELSSMEEEDDAFFTKEKELAQELDNTKADIQPILECLFEEDDRSTVEMAAEPRSEDPVTETHLELAQKSTAEENAASKVTKHKCRKTVLDGDEFKPFDPREPNFLPEEPDPEAERVDLKHRELDERKNSEEWMVDYALRQAVTKLDPARRRKVALLVEAFEEVMPITSFKLRDKHSFGYKNVRPIQACI